MRRLLPLLLIVLSCVGGCARIADRVLIPAQSAERARWLGETRREMGRRLGDRFEAFDYKTFDHLHMAAIMLTPERTPRGVVVVLHGLTDRKEAMLDIAEAFAEAGYIAVAPDLRAHGVSGGRYTSMGYREKRDMAALLDYLAARGIDVSHTGVLGGSLGAAVALQWAGIDPRVKAVVAVAPFAELRSEIEYFYRAHHISPLKAFLVELAAQQEGRFRIGDVSPLAAVKRIETPIFLAHGKRDEIIPASESRRLFEAARGPTALEEVDGTHMNIRKALGEKFLRRAIDWMDTYAAADAHQPSPGRWVARLPTRNMPGAMPLAKK